MKNLLLATSAFVILLSTSAMADNRITVLSSDLPPTDKKPIVLAHLKSVIQGLKPGERGVFLNGTEAVSVCTIDIPVGKQYNSDKAKLAVSGACARKLMAFAEAPQSGEGRAALNWPGSLDFISSNYGGGAFSLAVIDGNPVFIDEQEPNFTMAHAHIPSDGHITASRAVSPYSVEGQTEALSGMAVHWSTQGLDWSINNKHKTVVRRFVAAAIGERGGVLATFEQDRSVVLDNAGRGVNSPVTDYTLSGEKKLELIGIPRIIGVYTPLFERTVTDEAMPTGMTALGEQTYVGIQWDCKNCDLDLYAQAGPNAEPIYYGRTHTPEGQFFKDFTSGGDMMNGQEVIQFKGRIDLDQLMMAVNFYGGRSNKPITVKLRVATGGRVCEKTFTLAAGSGSRGRGLDDILSGKPVPDGWARFYKASARKAAR